MLAPVVAEKRHGRRRHTREFSFRVVPGPRPNARNRRSMVAPMKVSPPAVAMLPPRFNVGRSNLWPSEPVNPSGTFRHFTRSSTRPAHQGGAEQESSCRDPKIVRRPRPMGSGGSTSADRRRARRLDHFRPPRFATFVNASPSVGSCENHSSCHRQSCSNVTMVPSGLAACKPLASRSSHSVLRTTRARERCKIGGGIERVAGGQPGLREMVASAVLRRAPCSAARGRSSTVKKARQ